MAGHVFVIGTGRCGTTTFARACSHITNYTSGHETNAGLLPPDRFDYPDRHIEADNRLSWFLAELVDLYPDALYVHLLRDPDATARSFAKRLRYRPLTWAHRAPKGLRRAARRLEILARRDVSTLTMHSIVGAYAYQILGAPDRVWSDDELVDVAGAYVETVTANIVAGLAGCDVITGTIETAADWFPSFWEAADADGDLAAASAELARRHNAS